MKKVLSKRIFREFKANIGRYLALSVVIALCMYLVISIVGAANMIIKGTKEHQIRNHVEDGQFETFVELTDEQIVEAVAEITAEHFGKEADISHFFNYIVNEREEKVNTKSYK